MPLRIEQTYRLRHRKRPQSRRMQLRMVPMIDVVFLLLVFFLLTANFRSREGFLPAELPRHLVHAEVMELEPLLLKLESLADGTCKVQIGQTSPFLVEPQQSGDGFALLSSRLEGVLRDQGRHLDDPVKLVPAEHTKWDHVVKAYDAMWQINLHNIIFAMVD